MVSVFCAGMVHGQASRLSVVSPIRQNTEAAPNSLTGSGHCRFPCNDGSTSFTPSGAHLRSRVPETSPCHRQARQIGKLDPEGDVVVNGSIREESRPRPNSYPSTPTHRLSSSLASASGQPRVDSSRSKISDTGVRANPSVRGRACVAPEPLRDRVPDLGSSLRSLLRLSSAVSIPAPGRVGSTAVHHRPLRGY
jgi:hypothetical protein